MVILALLFYLRITTSITGIIGSGLKASCVRRSRGPGFRLIHGAQSNFSFLRKRTVTEHTWLSDGTVDKPLGGKVDHCLSAGVESLDSLCALRYSPLVLLMVCILNMAKCAAVYYTAYLHPRSGTNPREEASLVTIGDAAASFLPEKDSTTEHLPFASREEFTGRS